MECPECVPLNSKWSVGLNIRKSQKHQNTRSGFYRAAWNADAVLRWDFCPSVCLSVCLSVCPSVKRVHCDKREEKSVQIFIPCKRSFSLVLWEEEWLVGANPSIRNFGSTGPRSSEIADFEPIIARSASSVIPSKEVQFNRKSPTRFQTSLRWSSYVAPKSPKGGLKTHNAVFPL